MIEELRGLMSISFFFGTTTIDDAHSKFPTYVNKRSTHKNVGVNQGCQRVGGGIE